ncbi:DUF4199 domain-containing protein [Flavivirga sp. 57AJ16]|uniref:DUF4199 domain-containing protein n=1 Tax=Flavivirga sp. 57AJ16 TaxID=3025307 RepID=UPI0023672838|nr:DUF4199 domain-containing protein [Flavivirga sp. 57AJ16]MDD7884606.1 DUF4199 domain-containing protein [Flavivirga sp. 57AJ16]
MKRIPHSIRFGLLTSSMLIAYFLILAAFHKHINPAFSFFNAVITAFGICEAVRLKKNENLETFTYGEGFKTGVVTGFIATLVFTVFFLLYATEIHPTFLSELLQTIKGGFNIDIGMVTFIVAIMGFATTIVVVLAVMQFFKKTSNLNQNHL